MSDPVRHNTGPVGEDLVEAFFDRELDEGSRERFFHSLRSDLPRCAEVAKTQRIVSMLHEPIAAPDLSSRIMGELRERGAFVPARARRMIVRGRWAAAACLALGALGVAIAQRVAPDAFRLTPQPKPVSQVIRSGSSEAAESVQRLAEIVSARVLPERGSGRRGSRMIDLSLSPGATSVRLPGPGSGPIVVYTGSGAERFIVPDNIYIDRATALVLPLGQISPSRAGQDWVAISPDNPFLLPSVKARAGHEESTVKVRVVKP
jgi:hypothetical protein